MGRTLLIDGYNTYIRSFNVVTISNDDGEHVGGLFGFLRSVKTAITLFRPTEVVIAWDGPHSALRRKQMNKNYKANRKREFKPGICRAYDFLAEEQMKDNFSFQLTRIHEYLEMFPVKTLLIPYVEADDIIAEYVKLTDNDCIIYSTDADFKQLISDRVLHYNPIAKILLNKQKFIDKNGYDPKHDIFFKVVKGDNSDNLVGVRGIAEKTMLKLYPEFRDESFEMDSILDLLKLSREKLLKAETESQVKNYTLMIESKDALQLNYNIMQLNDIDVSIQAKEQIAKLVTDLPNSFERYKLRKMFMIDKLMEQIRNFDYWSSAFSGLQRR